jgi:spore maturation protein CgeB
MNRGMNIAFFGSSLVSAYWNGAATYYRGIIRQLHRRGHRVTFYEPDAFERQKHRDMEDPSWAKVVVYSAEDDGDVLRRLDEARSADVVIKASGVGVFDALLEKAVAGMRRAGMQTVFWDVDAPATLERVKADPADPFLPLIPRFDLVLTYGGGAPVTEAYESLGARRCVPVYNAVDPDTHYPAPPDRRFHADAAFLGNRLPDREARVEEFFLRPATECPDLVFLLGGSGWQDKPMPPSVRYLGHIYTHEHNAFNCTPRVVINVSRESMASYGFSPATRVFEAAGAGACLITDHWDGLELFLEPGREALVARDGGEVARHLRALTHAQAARIGEAARRRVLSQHTYAHRARQLETLLGAASTVSAEVLA